MRRSGWSAVCAALATCIAGTAAAVAQPVDPVVESQNYSKTLERQAPEASVDPTGDGNMFSFYHLSRLDFTLNDGTKVDCEDLRKGCPQITGDGGYEGEYSYFDIDTSPDHAGSADVPSGGGIYGPVGP